MLGGCAESNEMLYKGTIYVQRKYIAPFNLRGEYSTETKMKISSPNSSISIMFGMVYHDLSKTKSHYCPFKIRTESVVRIERCLGRGGGGGGGPGS